MDDGSIIIYYVLRILLNFCENKNPNVENFKSTLWMRGWLGRMLETDMTDKESRKAIHSTQPWMCLLPGAALTKTPVTGGLNNRTVFLCNSRGQVPWCCVG